MGPRDSGIGKSGLAADKATLKEIGISWDLSHKAQKAASVLEKVRREWIAVDNRRSA
jgi:hypothetical protein